MKDADTLVAAGCGNQAALGVAEVSMRDRGFLARDGGAGGFATAARGGGGGDATDAAEAFFAGAGRGAAVRAVRCLAVLAVFFGCGFPRPGFTAGLDGRGLDALDAFVGFCFPTDFFLEDAAAERPAFFLFVAGIATPFPFLAVRETRCAIYQCVVMKASVFPAIWIYIRIAATAWGGASSRVP